MSEEQKDRKVVVSLEQMKQIARYELTFGELEADFPGEEIKFAFPENYFYTLDDLKQALIHLKREDPIASDFVNDWFYPLIDFDEHFGLLTILDRANDDTPEQLREYAKTFPVSDHAQFRSIWGELDEIAEWVNEIGISLSSSIWMTF